MQKKWEMVKIKRNNNLFFKNSIEQKLVVFVIFALALALTTYIVFQLKTLFSSANLLNDFLANIIYVTLIFLVTRVIVRNIMLSISMRYYSYAIGLASIIYCYLMFFLKIDFVIKNIDNLFYQVLWVLPILAVNMIWHWLLAWLEYKARPFFALSELFNGFITLILLGLSLIGSYFINNFLIKKKTFNYLETLNLGLFILAGLFLIALVVLVFYAQKNSLFAKKENYIKKTTYFWISFLHIAPVLIFIIAQANLSYFNDWFFVFSSICLLILILFTWVTTSKSEVGGNSKIYNATYGMTLFLIILLSTIFYQVLKLDLAVISIVVGVSLFYINFLNIIILPRISFLSTILISLISWVLSLIFLIIWFISLFLPNVSLTVTNIPFNIMEIIWLIPLSLTTLNVTFSMVSLFWTIRKISNRSSAIYKLATQKVKGE